MINKINLALEMRQKVCEGWILLRNGTPSERDIINNNFDFGHVMMYIEKYSVVLPENLEINDR